MNGVLGHVSARLSDYMANEINSGLNHAPGAGSIARHVVQHYSAQPRSHDCLLVQNMKIGVAIVFVVTIMHC